MKCQDGYNINIWRRHNSGELLYRSISPHGNLSLGKGTTDNTGAARVYSFKNGNYKYQVIGGRGDREGQGTLEVYKSGQSILSRTCTSNG
ncbi:hypothetical protein AB0758_24440 [Tolypothrix bouteillei VB521301_2]|uniref:hypothetical protein n=1 Tax=Tolypothrix bouteillei TaxID=1246981 RepID=UPI0038B57DB2